jgi:hypothetical protein
VFVPGNIRFVRHRRAQLLKRAARFSGKGPSLMDSQGLRKGRPPADRGPR